MKTDWKLAVGSLMLLAGCVDEDNFCREPGYTCSEHVKEDNSIVCTQPGYTCGGMDNNDASHSMSSYETPHEDSSGAGADSGN